MEIIEKSKALWLQGEFHKAISLLEPFVIENKTEQVGAHRLLSRLYLKIGDEGKAIEALEEAIKFNPQNLWYYLMLGDLYYFDLKETEKAIPIYEKGLSYLTKPEKSTMSPYRYFLKRLSNIYYDKDDKEKALKVYEAFFVLEPSDFYASDFMKFAEILISSGLNDRAKEVLHIGVRTHPGDLALYNFAKEKFPKEEFPFREKRKRGSIKDVTKIPVKTPILREGDDIYKVIDDFTKDIRKEGDIITVSSCVAAICEGRFVTVDTIKPSFLARAVSQFVSHRNVPFGGAAPLANPYAMEIAIREAGALRIALAAFIGGIGKLLGKSGWFYRVAGPQSAMIDDPPGSIPPYDYSIVLGPEDSFETARKIQKVTGLRAAVIDANDEGIAWAVGYTEGVDKEKLEIALSDNPAGNEDSQTPIVIVRGMA